MSQPKDAAAAAAGTQLRLQSHMQYDLHVKRLALKLPADKHPLPWTDVQQQEPGHQMPPTHGKYSGHRQVPSSSTAVHLGSK